MCVSEWMSGLVGVLCVSVSEWMWRCVLGCM